MQSMDSHTSLGMNVQYVLKYIGVIGAISDFCWEELKDLTQESKKKLHFPDIVSGD